MDITEFYKPKYKPKFKNMKPYVIIEDGHGMNTPGKRSPLFEEYRKIDGIEFFPGDFIKENEFNQPVCNKLELYLNSAGIECIQLTPGDDDPPLHQRMAKENMLNLRAVEQGKNPIFISVHANAFQDTKELIWRRDVGGIETYYHIDKEQIEKTNNSDKLAECIHPEVISRTGLHSRGIKNERFYVLRNSKSPGVLAEGPFMTNPDEVGLLVNPHFHNIFAWALFQGVLKYYGLSNTWTNDPKEEKRV